ncbi:Ribosome assembly protein rrb1 [Rhizina undulata]
MSKRPSDAPSPTSGLKNRSRDPSHPLSPPPEMGEFEDNYDDEYESDTSIIEAGADGEHPHHDEVENNGMEVDQQVYMPSRRILGKDEILEPDPSAYHMLHSVNVNWPCLSFDILKDGMGEERRGFPGTVYLTAGTQAARAKDNEVMVVKLSGLSRMPQAKAEDSDDEDDDASDTEEDPILESRSLPCPSTTNRIRVSPHAHHAASMAESGDVYIWDLAPHYASLSTPGTPLPPSANKPAAILKMHGRIEGYALDWSPHTRETLGKIATGDNNGRIFVSTRKEDGTWATQKDPLSSHTGSIEELQWSPTERHVLSSASSDGTVKIYDCRASTKPQLSVAVSSSDVNVSSWCRTVPHLLATGADDGVWGVWDLRTFPNTLKGENVVATASFAFHKAPITSVEFHPGEDSIVAVASADETVTLWDLSVEVDDEESRDTGGVEDVPPQLLFVHWMREVKEVHWQKQAPGTVVGTGGDGFGVFKTISV